MTDSSGKTIQLKLPAQGTPRFVFYKHSGVKPYVTFKLRPYVFYNKAGDDYNSIFTAKEDSGGPLGDSRPNGDMGEVFSNDPFSALMKQFVLEVDVTLTPAEFQALNTPGVNAVPVPLGG